MPTLQELLASNDPEALKRLLTQNSSTQDAPEMAAPVSTPEPISPDANFDDMGRAAVPSADVFKDAKSRTAAPILPPVGNGPMANPADYKTAGTPPPSETEEESSDSQRNQVLQDVFSNPRTQMSQDMAGQGFTNNTVAGLQAAQDAANDRKNNADLGMAANMVMSGAMAKQGNTTIDPSNQNKYWEAQKTRAGEDVEQFQARGKKELDDPGSAASVNMREFAKPMLAKLGIKMPDNVSYSQMEKISPMVVKMFDAQESREQRSDILKDRQAERSLVKEGKDDEKISKRASELNNKLVEEAASSRSAFGKAANIRRSAEAIDTLIDQIPDKNNIDNRQIYELARSLDAMLSSGAATISGSEHLIPKTSSGDLAKIQEYITGIPKGAKQAEFIKRMQETVHRERDLASKQIRTAKDKFVAGYGDVKQKSPEKYKDIMKAHGMDEESIT